MPDEAAPADRAPMTEKQIRAARIGEPAKLNGPIRLVEYDPAWPPLFEREAEDYRTRVLSDEDRAESMVITNGALRWMAEWSADAIRRRYSLGPERDDRWRTGGSVEGVMDEAGLSCEQILAGIETYVRDHRHGAATG